jgi:hypothetical protein
VNRVKCVNAATDCETESGPRARCPTCATACPKLLVVRRCSSAFLRGDKIPEGKHQLPRRKRFGSLVPRRAPIRSVWLAFRR